MPLPAELRASMDSTVADIANIGDRYGGMLVAGLFLKEFVAATASAWAHLDIAGPAFNDGDAARLHAQGRHRLRGAHPGPARRGPRGRGAQGLSRGTERQRSGIARCSNG